MTPVVLNPPARHPILFKIWFNLSVTRALKKYHIDLFFSPDGYLSLKTNVPQVAVIHDLNFEHFPEDIPSSPRRYLRTYFPKFAQNVLLGGPPLEASKYFAKQRAEILSRENC